MDHEGGRKCLRCGGEMVLGGMPSGLKAQVWAPGLVRWSVWRGLRFNRRAARPVDTYRCTACGWLESYAN